MANKLFQELNLKHNPSRNGYDLSAPCNFTAKAGELLPIFHRTVMPGEKFRIRKSHFTRTSSVNTAAQTQIKEYFDFFFVPYRLLWKESPQILTNNLKNPVTATSPTSNRSIGTATPQFDYEAWRDSGLSILSTLKNEFGYNRAALSAKLLNHLGFPYISSDQIKDHDFDDYYGPQYLSAYPLLAYQCIYYSFFRNTQWETNQPYNYNVDYLGTSAILPIDFALSSSWINYWNNPTLFDIRYANYPKDLIFGVFPDAQFGDEAVVDITGSTVASDDITNNPVVDSDGNAVTVNPNVITTTAGSSDSRYYAKGLLDSTADGSLYAQLSSLEQSLTANFSILELRKAQFLQKYKEIIGSGRNDYKARIEKIFGTSVSDTLANIPIYLGGASSVVKISEVTNSNLADEDSEALIKGKGTGSGDSDLIEFEVPAEHGLIMCIYHCQPVVEYSLTALHFDLVKTEYDDYANPIFDQLGFEELPSYFLDCTIPHAYDYTSGGTRYTGVNNLGYTTRYYDYKTSLGQTLGDLRETDVNWIAPVNLDYLKNYVSNNRLYINANFFKVNPAILDPIFYRQVGTSNTIDRDYVTSDQFKVFCNFEVNAVRPLDYNGVPY